MDYNCLFFQAYQKYSRLFKWKSNYSKQPQQKDETSLIIFMFAKEIIEKYDTDKL